MLRSDSQRKVFATKQSDLASIAKTLQVQARYAEEWILSTQKKLAYSHPDHADTCEVDNINVTVNTLNRLVSQLSVSVSQWNAEEYYDNSEYFRSKLLSAITNEICT
jgi:hypothetical protein